MTIRKAEQDDYAQWLPLWQGYQAFYQTRIPDATTLITWSRFHDAKEPVHCAVASSDGQLTGLVHYIFHRSCWTAGDYCYLQDLFVSESVRGQGVGRALIHFVYDQARAQGASRVHWLTQSTNHDAMQLYDTVADKSGFIQYRKLFDPS